MLTRLRAGSYMMLHHAYLLLFTLSQYEERTGLADRFLRRRALCQLRELDRLIVQPDRQRKRRSSGWLS
jgi:hypothetical protein